MGLVTGHQRGYERRPSECQSPRWKFRLGKDQIKVQLKLSRNIKNICERMNLKDRPSLMKTRKIEEVYGCILSRDVIVSEFLRVLH